MEISRRIAAAYDQVAEAYAEKNAVIPPAYLDLGPRFLALASPGPRVLDVGCGAGRDLAWLTQQGAVVVGADRSSGMLAQARRFPAGGVVQADMRMLPFRDAVFGGVWCSASLLHLPKLDAPGAAPVERFFARYRQDEAEAMLGAAGFEILERRVEETPNRSWLTFLSISASA
jgi:SAM-dependent methyltransferase